jgi:purine-nucleoside phosphorylase
MSWPYDNTEPLVTPARLTEHQRQRAGLSPEEWALPPLLVATFQVEAQRRLVARAGIDVAGAPGQCQVGAVEGSRVAVVRITIGAPAAALVAEEAIARGTDTILVVGSAGSLSPDLRIGGSAVVTGAEREDGTSHHYLPSDQMVTGDPALSHLLGACAAARGLEPRAGRSWTIDAPYRETPGAIRRHRQAGVLVAEMEAAAIFAVAHVRGARAALLVAVSDELFGSEWTPGFGEAPYVDTLRICADAVMDCAARM